MIAKARYLDIATARSAGGMRLVASVGVPGPWSESAKQLLFFKNIPFQLVAQHVGQANAELVEWTGVRNAPVAVWEDLPPVHRWDEILWLAEQIEPSRPLVPEDPADRARMFGLSREICGREGFGWQRRLMLYADRAKAAGGTSGPDPVRQLINREYGAEPVSLAAAPRRAAAIVAMLARRLHAQAAVGSDYFVGSAITACDIFWACFSQMLQPLDLAECPAPPSVLAAYSLKDPVVLAAFDPILIQHRDRIFERHLRLPMVF